MDTSSSSSNAESETSVIDETALPKLLGISAPETLVEYYESYLETAEEIFAEIQQSYQKRDMSAVGDGGHKLKSSSRAVGADKLADCCYALEQAGRNGDDASVDQAMPELENFYSEAKAWLSDFIKRYS